MSLMVRCVMSVMGYSAMVNLLLSSVEMWHVYSISVSTAGPVYTPCLVDKITVLYRKTLETKVGIFEHFAFCSFICLHACFDTAISKFISQCNLFIFVSIANHSLQIAGTCSFEFCNPF